MKINETQRLSAVGKYRQQTDVSPSETVKKKQTDKVQISEEAKGMLQSSKMQGTGRAERVQELKQEVSSGTYSVDSGKIAEKILPYLKL